MSLSKDCFQNIQVIHFEKWKIYVSKRNMCITGISFADATHIYSFNVLASNIISKTWRHQNKVLKSFYENTENCPITNWIKFIKKY